MCPLAAAGAISSLLVPTANQKSFSTHPTEFSLQEGIREEDQLLDAGEVFDYACQKPLHSFNSFVCEECGEMVVEEYGRIKQGEKVCIPCAGNP